MRYIPILVAIAAVVGAFLYGAQTGKRSVMVDILKARAESAEEKKDIDNEVKNLSDDELLQRALGFVRGGG